MFLQSLLYSQRCHIVVHTGACIIACSPLASRCRMLSGLSCRVGSACSAATGRCLLGEADGALYMAFMGTKQRRDLVTNAQVLQEPIWPEDFMSETQEASQVLEAVTSDSGFYCGLSNSGDVP